MGRSKSAPQQRNETKGGETLLLGRRALDHKSLSLESTVRVMMAEEVLVPDKQEIEQELMALEDSDDDDVRSRKTKKRLRQHASKKKKKKKCVSSSSRNTTPAKRVSFADESVASSRQVGHDATDRLSWVIPPPQVQVLCWDEESDGCFGTSAVISPQDDNRLLVQRVVRYHCPPEKRSESLAEAITESHHMQDDNSWILASLNLPEDVRVEVVLDNECCSEEGQSESSLSSLAVTSHWGVIDMLRLALGREKKMESSIHAIGRAATRDGSMGVYLCRSDEASPNVAAWYLQVRLLPRAFEICCPLQLPAHLNRQSLRSKRLEPAADLRMALAALFPDSIVADSTTVLTTSSAAPASQTMVTAKRVYGLTDNVQLQATMASQQEQEEQPAPLKIPGLIPSLRPYQESAVRWMLEREGKGSTQCNNEWELAWVVLETIDGTFKATSLVDWKPPQEDGKVQSRPLLYCPFTGWLAKSVAEARAMTIPSSSLTESNTQGGILAESMGLGKTVEVLACILANPRPKSEDNTACSAKRKLDFDEPEIVLASSCIEDTPPATSNVSNNCVGVVNDFSEFGDMDDDSEDETAEDDVQPVRSEVAPNSTVKPKPAPVPITPDRPAVACDPVDERWLDDDVVGSCICSSLITFSMRKKKQPIVLCSSCDEPMHKDCAAFESETEMMKCTKHVRLRQQFSNRSLECRLCDKEMCPCCVVSHQNPIRSSGTLIITPAAILGQWNREIKRHATAPDGKPLKIAVYEGMNRLLKTNGAKNERFKYVHPRHLAAADIVLMTFDALMTDLGHSDDNKYIAGSVEADVSGNLRARKRYRVVPSPLQSIRYWRICLDEAQRVETPTAGSARMALKLQADRRWCVSGTPIGRGRLEDLYGLLLFLRLEPFSDKQWFTKCFNPAYRNVPERISHLLRNVFWRSTKALERVRKQMGVPEQIENRAVLRFSSIEKHFYDRQLEQTLATAGDISDRERSGKKRKASQLDLLAERLHRLRAACCHPQVGSSGIGQIKKRRTGSKHGNDGMADGSLGSRVMSMSQILDRFIDDAKQKCEEAQRVVILHTNGMAAVSMLKVQAKDRGVKVTESDLSLIRKSCKLYQESLHIGEENAHPSLAIGEATVSGSVGFRSPHRKVRNSQYILDWKFDSTEKANEIWSKIDFEGPARKITQIRARASRTIPQELIEETSERFRWYALSPKSVLLQVSCSAVGGEFVDVASFAVPKQASAGEDYWVLEGGFRTNKSKNWRLLVESYHEEDAFEQKCGLGYESVGYYVGLQVELYEANIASDPLQRLHCLHNASLAFQSLRDVAPEDGEEDVERTISAMKSEADKIESLYVNTARSVHNECHRRLDVSLKIRQELERELCSMSRAGKNKDLPRDAWDDCWWDDFLVIVRMYGSDSQQRLLYERLLPELDGVLHGALEPSSQNGVICFPEFEDINGLRTALNLRISAIRDGIGGRSSRKSRAALRAVAEGPSDSTTSNNVRETCFRCPVGAHARCMNAIHGLSPHPTQAEKIENSHCKVCKADWFQTGPKCRHCKIEEDLEDLNPDSVTVLLLTSIHSILKGPLGISILSKSSGADSATRVGERAKAFFEVLQAQKRERKSAWRLWRTHLDLLNDLDELSQCKSTMRLSYEGEDLTKLPEEQLNAIVVPCDVSARYHDHAAKQAMALGDLRRAKDTMRYLENQSSELATQGGGPKMDREDKRCSVCLSAFEDSDRAVLRCGHSFHMTPCLERLRSGSSLISCPMRCRLRTDPKDVLIATERSRNDGSRNRRTVRGSWGTKVSRLVADVLDIRDLGDKGVVFSQWEDMLDIVQQALDENDVSFVRATSLRQIGASTEAFRHRECTILLLNVKNGAEGLNVLEATHVFMVEPLLNCGLDSQAINRICRIGQNRKTYVHRYLVEDTIEMKIDRLRAEHQDQQIEDAIHEGKKSAIRAGGIDGGFQTEEELLDILQP